MSPIATSLVDVDEEVCAQLSQLLSSQTIPKDREEIYFEGLSPFQTGNLLFFVVAICHQTTVEGHKPLSGQVDGKSLRGWDYLLQQFVSQARHNLKLLEPASWASMTANDLQRIYRNSDGEDLLIGLSHRASLIQDLGHTMGANGWSYIDDVYELCGGAIADGEPNLLDALSRFRAYSDPIRKKSYFLLSLMKNTGIWSYRDLENLGPPVDYHEVRGHLRIGTVRVVDEALRHKLLNRIPVNADEDIAIRGAVLNAIMRISEETGLRNPSQLHYLFWNVLRNYCTPEAPNCLGQRRETYLPERYKYLAVDTDGRHACPFSPVCESANREPRYYEHVFETDFY